MSLFFSSPWLDLFCLHFAFAERREDRIHHWRDFNSSTTKKKKAKKNEHVLG